MKVEVQVCDICGSIRSDFAIDWLHFDDKDVCGKCSGVIVMARRLRLIDKILDAREVEPND